MSLKQTSSPIYKFITYVVSNLYPLLEYAENIILKYIEQFREEADDLGIQITDTQLRKYIERFDQIKNSPKITDKELKNYTLSQLIKLITSQEGVNSDEEIDNTPDVVYNEGNKVIYNGSKEGNCIIYGRGERWCITKGSYANYRYSSSRGYPTFYLAKNGDLPNSNELSFVAIQVRDTPQESDRYVYTNRNNNPNESQPMNFNELMRQIPWLADIPDIKRILKYIPVTQAEKASRTYSNTPITIREWMDLEFPIKKQYLVIRGNNSGGETFSDISDNEFISKYLPKIPQLATFVAITPGVFNGIDLLKNVEKFTTQVQGSIIANFRDLVELGYLKTDTLDFKLKKFLVEIKKWALNPEQRIYVTEDGNTIVLLTFTSDDIKLGLYQENDDYPNAKITKRTAKYLLEYPELDKIPLQNLIDLTSKNIIDSSIITSVLEKAKTDSNSAIISKNIDGKQIVIDSNSFTSFKIEDGKISKIPFTDEDVQTVFAQEENNQGFQESALNLIKAKEDIPSSIDKEAFLSIVNSIPYPQRIYLNDNTPSVILTAQGDTSYNIFTIGTTGNESFLKSNNSYDIGGGWRTHNRNTTRPITTPEQVQSIVNFLRETNRPLNDIELLNTLNGGSYSSPSVSIIKQFVQANPPLSPENTYRPVVFNDTLLIINTANPRESKQLSDRSGKLVKANLSPTQAARLIGTTPAAAAPAPTPGADAGRRGRPAGVPNAPAAPAANAPAGQGASVAEIMANYQLGNGFTQLPGRSFTRLNTNTGIARNINNNRGASRRNNLLGNSGRVVRDIEVGPSNIYIIRLADQSHIASVVVQPGNLHYLITPTSAVALNSPADLLTALQQRNLAEARGYIMNEYLDRNPHHKGEFKELIKKTITEKQTNK